MSDVVLNTEGLSYATPDGRVLAKNISVELRSGQLLLVSGPNGAGKSTFLKAILGKVPLQSGRVNLGVPARHVAFLPQTQNNEFYLPLTLRDVLKIALGRRSEDDLKLYPGLLDPQHLDLAWNTASGGERKRALLIRTLLREPRLLLLDEPLNHLDQASRACIMQAIVSFLKASRRQHRAVVMVSHEVLNSPHMSGVDIVPLRIGG